MPCRHILIPGGTGFIGTHLKRMLPKDRYHVTIVSRTPGYGRITWDDLECGINKDIDAVVNLTGQNVLDPCRRWTPGFKSSVYCSRINSSCTLVDKIKKAQNVKVFITVCGISLYKPNDKIHTELECGEVYDFMSKLCIDWEYAATLPCEVKHCRNIKIRTGVVIGESGGVSKSLYIPFFLGLGGPIGKGTQYLPWIHIDDLCALIQYCIEEDDIVGVLNGVAPDIITNNQFTEAFSRSVKRPACIPIPEFAIKALFGKERAAAILKGPKVEPHRTLKYGFRYLFPTIGQACDEVVTRFHFLRGNID